MEATKEHWEEEVSKYEPYYSEWLAGKHYDAVESPEHYCSGANECIDVMEWMFGTEAVADFCRCNIFKYRFRAHQKNGEEDIKKAEWYENKLKRLLDKMAMGERLNGSTKEY